MPALKYSRQRESIMRFLLSRYDHPTADTVYLHVKEEFPRISLGTVYRNLNLLADMGEALKITTLDGGDRFDGCTKPHYHFTCTSCGAVIDLDMDVKYFHEMNEAAGKNFDGLIESHTTLFSGICPACFKKGKN